MTPLFVAKSSVITPVTPEHLHLQEASSSVSGAWLNVHGILPRELQAFRET